MNSSTVNTNNGTNITTLTAFVFTIASTATSVDTLAYRFSYSHHQFPTTWN